MKGHAALVELSELDGSEAELRCYGRDGCAGVGVIARYEDGLLTPLQRRICSKLCDREVIEGLHEARTGKRLGHEFRREATSQLFRSNAKGIHHIDDDLAVPLLELLRNVLVRREWDGEEDDLGSVGVLNRLGNDAGAELFCQECERLGSAGVCDSGFDFLARENACERSATSRLGVSTGIKGSLNRPIC